MRLEIRGIRLVFFFDSAKDSIDLVLEHSSELLLHLSIKAIFSGEL